MAKAEGRPGTQLSTEQAQNQHDDNEQSRKSEQAMWDMNEHQAMWQKHLTSRMKGERPQASYIKLLVKSYCKSSHTCHCICCHHAAHNRRSTGRNTKPQLRWKCPCAEGQATSKETAEKG